MAYAEVTYTVAASPSTDYTIPFPFLRDSNLVVEVNGETRGVSFSIAPTKDEITIITPALLPGQLVTIRRRTPVSDSGQYVAFSDPSTLRRDDLETMRKQHLFIAQELVDSGTTGLQLDPADSKWEAEGRIIKNVGSPADATDAATKGYVDTALVASGALPDPSTGDPFDVIQINETGDGYQLGSVVGEKHLLRIKPQLSGPVGYAGGWVLPAFSSGYSDSSQRAPLEVVTSLNTKGLFSLAANTFDFTLSPGKWCIEAVGHLRGLTDTASTNSSSGQLAITDTSGTVVTESPDVITGVSMVTGSDVAPVTIPKPAALAWTPPILPKRIRKGYRGDVSARSFRHTSGSTQYVDVALGNDGTGTGAIGAPFKSIWKAAQVAGVKTIKVAPGIYGFDNRWGNPTYPADLTTLNVEKWPIRAGEVYATSALTITSWSAVGTAWEETGLAFPAHVVDLSVLTEDGAPMRYAEVSSVALCQATPGTFHRTGTGGSETVTVHPLDSGEPGHDILVLRQATAASLSVNATLGIMPDYYIDGITFIGAQGCVIADNTTAALDGSVTAVNCRFLSSSGNGLFCKAVDRVILEDCEAHNNEQDGFHHTNNGTFGTRAVEINCKANNNGTTSISDTANGFTIHSYCSALRIGCTAERNVGPNYADTGTPATPATASSSWLVGCSAGPSNAFSLTGQMTGFQFTNANNAFLYECDSSACLQDLLVGAGCTAYVDSCFFSATTNSGTLTPSVLFTDASVTKTAQMSSVARIVYLVDLAVATTFNLRAKGSTSSHSVVADYPSYLVISQA